MSRAALRSALVLTGVTGLLGTGLLQAAVAGAAEPWQLSADGTTATYTSVDTGSELPFLVPAGVTSLDVEVLGDEEAAPIAQQIDVQPGSTLLIDLGHDESAPVPSGVVGTAPSEDETTEQTAPASWHIGSRNGAAASIRVADPAELVVAEQNTAAAAGGAPDAGTATPAEDVPAGTSAESAVPTDGVPPAVLTDVPGQERDVVVQDPAGHGAPVSVVVSFAVPTPGVLPAELQAPEWLAPAGAATAAGPDVRVQGTHAAEEFVPVEPSAPSGSPAPTDALAPVETPVEVDTTTPAEAPAPEDTPVEVEAPATTETLGAGEASAPEDAPASEAQAPEAPEVTEAPVVTEDPAPVESSVDAIATEPTAPAAMEASAQVLPPQPTAPTASVPEPAAASRRAAPPLAASHSAVPAEPSAKRQSADERPTVDLQTASSMVTVDLFDTDGVGILAVTLAGVVALGVGVTVTVGARRRD